MRRVNLMANPSIFANSRGLAILAEFRLDICWHTTVIVCV